MSSPAEDVDSTPKVSDSIFARSTLEDDVHEKGRTIENGIVSDGGSEKREDSECCVVSTRCPVEDDIGAQQRYDSSNGESAQICTNSFEDDGISRQKNRDTAEFQMAKLRFDGSNGESKQDTISLENGIKEEPQVTKHLNNNSSANKKDEAPKPSFGASSPANGVASSPKATENVGSENNFIGAVKTERQNNAPTAARASVVVDERLAERRRSFVPMSSMEEENLRERLHLAQLRRCTEIVNTEPRYTRESFRRLFLSKVGIFFVFYEVSS